MNKAPGNPITMEQLNGGLRSFRPSLHFECDADSPAPPHRQLTKLFLTNELPMSYASAPRPAQYERNCLDMSPLSRAKIIRAVAYGLSLAQSCENHDPKVSSFVHVFFT